MKSVFLANKADNSQSTRLYRSLKERARESSSSELRSLLRDFGSDAGALEAIDEGVSEHFSSESAGDWTSDATKGYDDALAKVRIKEDFHLEAAKAAIQRGGVIDEKEHSLKEIFLMISSLAQKVNALEAKYAGNGKKARHGLSAE